jgi:hypothetical protein
MIVPERGPSQITKKGKLLIVRTGKTTLVPEFAGQERGDEESTALKGDMARGDLARDSFALV